MFRRHGVTAPANAKGEDWFWPDQAFRDMLACLIIFGVMLGLVVFGGHGNKIDVPGSRNGLYELGRQGGPARPRRQPRCTGRSRHRTYPARPEWYFLFLFQLLKYFEGDQEILSAPWSFPTASWCCCSCCRCSAIGRMRKFGHVVGIIVVVALLAGVGWLTYEAMADDAKNQFFQQELKLAEKEAKRAVQLAHSKIPEEGAKYLLRRDPERMGPELFSQNCATCHVPKEAYKPGKDKDKAARPGRVRHRGVESQVPSPRRQR